MKVALVHEYLTNFAGSEQVLLALHEMFPEAPIYTAMYYPEKCPQFKDATVHTSFLQKFPKNKEKVYIPLMPLAVEGYDLSEYDLIISDSHLAAKGVITKPDAVHICYCHTPIRYAWSPEVDPRSSSSWLRRLANHYLRIWDFYAARRVDYFIANSNYVANRIRKYYRTDAAVIFPPVDTKALKPPADAKVEDYYVLFGRLIDYKKPDLVVAAFNKLGKRLVVLGRGPMLEQLRIMAKSNIEFIEEYLPYDEVAKIFASASAMVFPVEEDFGIGMVDMMACGRPVIAYGMGGATDIVIPGKTGEFVESQSVEAIVEAVANFEPMRYDKKVLQSHATTFDREIFKQKMGDFIERKAWNSKTI
jgi:glycosyltransferase involved in cell wall biosynthesis